MRGKCVECGYTWRLTKSGLIVSHKLYSGFNPEGFRCAGSKKPPKKEIQGGVK